MDPTNACAFIIRDAIKNGPVRDRSLVNVTVLFRDRYCAKIN